jgi:serine/threonine protein kinase
MKPSVSKSARRDRTEIGASLIAPLPPDLRAGTEFAGYRIDELVGRGGMGVVYRAEHVHLRRRVALKLLLPELSAGEAFRERFVREARTAAAIQHPNVVTVYDAGEAEGLLYIAMQYVDGTDLASLLAEQGPLEPERALVILGEVAGALDAAHALGVVHRDVKPGNVLVDETRAYLADFGLTRATSSKTALTVEGHVVGTIDYMPPEQIESGSVDSRADVYSLGCVLYHCLSGAVPFERESQVSMMYAHLQDQPPPLAARQPGLPEALDGVIATAMAKRPDDRYGSCGELIAAARAALTDDAPPRAASAPKVLVAAGDQSVRTLVRVSLAAGRLTVLEAADGEEALRTASRELPDLVIVDAGLTGTSAAELARALREGATTSHAKVVILSARGDAIDRRALAAAGADGHMTKPFSSLQLLHTVGDLLGPEVISAGGSK